MAREFVGRGFLMSDSQGAPLGSWAVFPGTMLLVAPVGRPRRERMLVGRALAAGAAGVLLVLCATERATHAPAHIAALERQQELKVVMSECVDCLSACPGYVQNRSSFDNTSSFNEFSRLAQKECGMCYQGVKGPCPADANNHGVLRAVDNKRGGLRATSLHAAPPPLPSGWTATWDAQVHRFYFYNSATRETTWDSPEVVPSRHEEIYQGGYHKLTQGGGGVPAAPGDCAAVDPQDLDAVVACWHEKGIRDMQVAKNAAFYAAVAGSYDKYDVSKGRAIHKVFKGKVGGGEGYWPAEPPSFPKPGDEENQGLDAAIAENWDAYDTAHGLAIPKSSSAWGAGEEDTTWHDHWGDHHWDDTGLGKGR